MECALDLLEPFRDFGPARVGAHVAHAAARTKAGSVGNRRRSCSRGWRHGSTVGALVPGGVPGCPAAARSTRGRGGHNGRAASGTTRRIGWIAY
jgi:hypothetical protein